MQEKTKRNKQIWNWRQKGMSHRKLAIKFGLSHPRIITILKQEAKKVAKTK